MLDIKFIRQHSETIQQIADQKGITVSMRELLSWDDRKKRLLQEIEQLREQRNRQSDQIRILLQKGKRQESESIKEHVRMVNHRLTLQQHALQEAHRHFNELMLLVPNLVSPDTPIGLSDADNVELKRVGTPPQFEFDPMDHVTLGEMHHMIDIPRGVKVAGKRNYFLKGCGLQLHRAVQQLTLDLLSRRGFTALEVPLMVRQSALVSTGFFPAGKDQTYQIAGEDKWLAGTSEVPLISYYSDEIIDVSEPVKLAALSLCFRSEVGSTGKDVRGLYRVHQFSKVEQVVLCKNDPAVSERILQEITNNAEELLQLLDLPYRTVAVCTGDMSQKTYNQYDIETWMPSRNGYGETHSSSNLLDFQARRSNIRYRDADGTLRYCHTLNNTAVASPRILIPLLENHQQEDGAIRIPEALRPYMNGIDQICR